MFLLPFPDPSVFRLRTQEGQTRIFDPVRKKFVALSPEEWVRQNLLYVLREHMGYPQGRIAVEKAVWVHGLAQRYDIVVYDGELRPWMLVECKEPGVPIDDRALGQLLRYQHALQCPYWLLSNGQRHYCARTGDGPLRWLDGLPAYEGGILPAL